MLTFKRRVFVDCWINLCRVSKTKGHRLRSEGFALCFLYLWHCALLAVRIQKHNCKTSLLSGHVGDDFTLARSTCPGSVLPFPLMMGLLVGLRSWLRWREYNTVLCVCVCVCVFSSGLLFVSIVMYHNLHLENSIQGRWRLSWPPFMAGTWWLCFILCSHPATVCESWYFTSTSEKFQSFKVNGGFGICLLSLNYLMALRPVAETGLSHLNCFAENYFFHQRGPRLYFWGELTP